MIRILVYADFLAPSGFSQVTENIFSRMEPFLEKYNIKMDVLAYNLRSTEDIEYSPRIKVHHPKNYAKNMSDPFYVDGFLKYLQKKPFDLVWIINDYPLVAPFISLLNGLKKWKKEQRERIFKMMIYFPVDSIIAGDYLEGLKFFHKSVTYTNYGAEMIFNQTKDADYTYDLSIIPHGIDTVNFFRMPDDQRLALREKYGLPKDVYIFGTVNKNGPRKDIGGTLLAFSYFKKRNPDAKVALYLHTYHADTTGINVKMAAKNLNLKEGKDYFLPVEGKYNNADYTTSDMNEVYNCFDCFVSTSMGEGWGLTVTQAMATELPIVCGDHTSLSEICNEDLSQENRAQAVYSVPSSRLSEVIVPNEFAPQPIRYRLDPVAVAEQMEEAMKDGNRKTYQPIIDRYNWDDITREWEKLILEVL